MDGIQELETALKWHGRAKELARTHPGRKVYLWHADALGKPRIWGTSVDDAYPTVAQGLIPKRIGFYMGNAYYPEK